MKDQKSWQTKLNLKSDGTDPGSMIFPACRIEQTSHRTWKNGACMPYKWRSITSPGCDYEKQTTTHIVEERLRIGLSRTV